MTAMAVVDWASRRARRPEALIAKAIEIADAIALSGEDGTDTGGAFVAEAISSLQVTGLLGMLAPVDLGGPGATIADVSLVCERIGRRSASLAMVFAIHQVQVATLLRHGRSAFLAAFVGDMVVGRQALLAAAASEPGVDGGGRPGSFAVGENGVFALRMLAPTIAYREHADGILVAVPRGAKSGEIDEQLVLCRAGHFLLGPKSTADSIGFGAAEHLGHVLEASDASGCIFDEPFNTIAQTTIAPASLLLLSHVWLGVAATAVALAQHRDPSRRVQTVGTAEHHSRRFAELVAKQLQLASAVESAFTLFPHATEGNAVLESTEYGHAMDSLAAVISTRFVSVIEDAAEMCGTDVARATGEMGRLVRGAHSAASMVNNTRILAATAQGLFAEKEES
jgi:acyl-CoA dehydrogenase